MTKSEVIEALAEEINIEINEARDIVYEVDPKSRTNIS